MNWQKAKGIFFASRRILTKTVPNWEKARVTSASRAISSMGSGKL